MTILLVLTSLILISIAVWQLTKILELSKPTDFDDSEIASDNDNDIHEIQCQVSEIYNVKKELEKEISEFISTEIEWIPINSVIISKEKNDDLINFFESLEQEDDVQNVFSNAKFS